MDAAGLAEPAIAAAIGLVVGFAAARGGRAWEATRNRADAAQATAPDDPGRAGAGPATADAASTTAHADRAPLASTVVVAVFTSVLFVLVVLRFGVGMEAVAYAFLAAVGVQLSAIDLKHRLLPNAIVMPSIAIAIVLLVLAAALGSTALGNAALGSGSVGDVAIGTARWDDLLRAVAGGGILFVLYLILALISPRGLGMGDVKLAALVGLYLGFQGWSHLFVGTLVAFVLAAVVAVVVMAAGRGSRRTLIPFGPMMLAGAAVVLLTGNTVTGMLLPSL